MDLQSLRTFCLDLPAAEESVKWGNDLCFTVAEKIFCVTELDGDFAVTLKTEPETYEELVGTENVVSAPYVGRYKYIQVNRASRFSDAEWQQLIRDSYQLIASKLPRKKQQELGLKLG